MNAFGSDPYLRFQLRSAIRDIRNDDQSILWEGPESLSTEELKAACEERGMRASGLSRDEYLTQLQHWLDMSVSKSKAKGAANGCSFNLYSSFRLQTWTIAITSFSLYLKHSNKSFFNVNKYICTLFTLLYKNTFFVLTSTFLLGE